VSTWKVDSIHASNYPKRNAYEQIGSSNGYFPAKRKLGMRSGRKAGEMRNFCGQEKPGTIEENKSRGIASKKYS